MPGTECTRVRGFLESASQLLIEHLKKGLYIDYFERILIRKAGYSLPVFMITDWWL